MRIIVKDYDPVTNLVVLHDVQRELSDIVVPVKSIEEWKYGNDIQRKVRLQFFMRHIKRQGGKQTIMEMIESMKSSKYYNNDRD